MSQSTLTYERFITESTNMLREGKTIRGVSVFCEKEAWLNIKSLIEEVNKTRVRWFIEFIETHQKDFFILIFRDIKELEADLNFFIKVISDEPYYIFYVFSYVLQDDFKKFKSLIKNIRNVWLAWIGSRFMENFTDFMEKKFPDFDVSLIKYTTEYRRIKNKEKVGSSIHWESRTKEDLAKDRAYRYSTYKELLNVKLARYNIQKGHISFKLTLSDRTEFTLESGDLLEFLNIYKTILDHARQLRDSFNRKIQINRQQKYIKNIKRNIERYNIERFEMITIDMKEPIFKSWYNNLVDTFSLGYLSNFNILSVVLEKGNPYFLAEIVDLDSESRFYLSAVHDSIRISPSNQQTKPSTISKIFSILQSRIDPSIDMSE